MALPARGPARPAGLVQGRPKSPTVSIIVPCFQQAGHLGMLVSALAKQVEAPLFEVILIDNGPFPEVTVDPGLPFPMKVLHEPRPGSYAARNTGLHAAGGSVLLFTDADCRPHPAWVSRMAAHALTDPASVHAGDVHVTTHRRPPSWAELYDLLLGFPIERYVRQGFGITANLAVHRDLMRQVGPFDPSRRSAGTIPGRLRARAQGHPLRFWPDAVVDHPARDAGELRRKFRRLQGGAAMSRRGRLVHAARVASKGLLPLGNPLRARKREAGMGTRLGQGVRLVAVGYMLRWVAIAESVRMVWGGEPRR
jgi:hypothetical protein